MEIYLTMRVDSDLEAGVPVKAYADEAKANKAVAEAKAAREEYNQLYDGLLRPYRVDYLSCSSSQHDEYRFKSSDGLYYAEEAQQKYADRFREFEERPDVKELRKRMSRGDYIISIELED